MLVLRRKAVPTGNPCEHEADPNQTSPQPKLSSLNSPCTQVDRDVLDTRALNVAADGCELPEAARLQNHMLAVNAAVSIACAVPGLSPRQLLEPEAHRQVVLTQVFMLMKYGLMQQVMRLPTGELLALARPGETLTSLRRLPAEALMLRWLEHHVKTYAALHPDQREHLAVGETIVASFEELASW